MSSIINLLERLAEMFPKENYSQRLESYIKSRRPTHPAEIEHLIHQFERSQFKGSL